MTCLYDINITHVRAEPVRHEVHHRSYQWFVDLGQLPELPRTLRALARFEARDHFGDPRRSIRENVDALLAEHGVDLRGGSVTMLANARSLGYVFNPLSLFWCHRSDSSLACVIAEVHNTYGGAHCYVLRTDDSGRAETSKRLYVSPFNPVDGYYRMSLPEPEDRIALTISLHRPGQAPFATSVRGARRPATPMSLMSAALRHPFESHVVRALITAHGIALWRKRLPVQPRPGGREVGGVRSATSEMPAVHP
ncbi:MAG: uncharacterized protein QOG80_2281 [Pseudonocardiales bacterium]|nr:uncharacterized protein [Pseudonocardiales bacterium]